MDIEIQGIKPDIAHQRVVDDIQYDLADFMIAITSESGVTAVVPDHLTGDRRDVHIVEQQQLNNRTIVRFREGLDEFPADGDGRRTPSSSATSPFVNGNGFPFESSSCMVRVASEILLKPKSKPIAAAPSGNPGGRATV